MKAVALRFRGIFKFQLLVEIFFSEKKEADSGLLMQGSNI